ncbi:MULTISPECIES: ABC transporter substrate-binding protein [Petrotoga]|uniref:Carbohydrate ABC transporter substrate-binding protein (CUT1 family) n=2 Tax=Petrotoga sibirica TaxID=156202 RepID=A0A4R8ESM0_9BACT|nr:MULTISPECIES: ABC transporter substrate-binding protein [Petrotoga]POZ89358.1 ABC transporter substrate-binding protein [Petrotoga sibirica DSM 13575]POZ91719.1 ABC transporter substrate-binding protein [Petrotoga sp. SL27]TDX15502.1 carbohydrate ABC transporter substrate-binding protein (CUT1 family) [Petrotoga sibirica]
MRKLALFVLMVLLVGSSFSAVTITITGWPGNPAEESGIKEIVQKFNSSHQDIQVRWDPIAGDYKQTLMTRLSGGQGPDLFYVDVYVFEELARANVLQPLNLYIQRDGFDIDDFYPNLVDAFIFNNRIYGIAKDFSTLALFYNKEIFDQYGVPYPTTDDTWFDLLYKATLLKERGYEAPLSLAADFNRLIPLIHSFGGRLVKEDLSTALTEKEAVAALKLYTELVTKHELAYLPSTLGAGWLGDAFAKEMTAMVMSGPWTLGFIRESFPNVEKKTGIVELPSIVEKSSMIYTVAWSMNRQSAHKDEAWEVLKFLVTEGQEIFVEKAGVLGSRQSVAAEDTDPMKKVFYDSVEFGYPWRVPTPTGIFAKANDYLNSILNDLFAGRITIEEAVNSIEKNYKSWVTQ